MMSKSQHFVLAIKLYNSESELILPNRYFNAKRNVAFFIYSVLKVMYSPQSPVISYVVNNWVCLQFNTFSYVSELTFIPPLSNINLIESLHVLFSWQVTHQNGTLVKSCHLVVLA